MPRQRPSVPMQSERTCVFFLTVCSKDGHQVRLDTTLLQNTSPRSSKLRDTEDFVFVGDLSRTESDIEAPVLFVGYGVTAPKLNYGDYAGIDVRGKIVAYFENAPPLFAA